jgi:hypothetical protein
MITNSTEKQILLDVLNNPNDTFYESVLSDFLDEQNIDHDFRKPLHNNIVKELKPYQEKCLAIWANHWTNIGLCTNPTDEKKAEQYFFDIYKELSFPIPEKIVWFDNPFEMWNQLKYIDSTQIDDNLWNQLWAIPVSQITNLINGALKNQILNQVWSPVYDQVWLQLQTVVNDKSIWNVIKNLNNRLLYGLCEIHWLACFAFSMQVLRLKLPKSITPYLLLAQQINWWSPTSQIIYSTRKKSPLTT